MDHPMKMTFQTYNVLENWEIISHQVKVFETKSWFYELNKEKGDNS